MKNVGNSSRGRSQGYAKIFRAPMYAYRAHCAVIFPIAQLSCYYDFNTQNAHKSSANVTFQQRLRIIGTENK